MWIMKNLLLALTTTALLFVTATAQREERCTPELVQERVDCYDTDGPCDPLPTPLVAFGPQPGPEGYYIETLRKGVYGVSTGAYWYMVLLAEAEEETSRQKGKKSKGKKGKKGQGKGKNNKKRMKGKRNLKAGVSGTDATKYTLTIIDFPEGPSVNLAIGEIVTGMMGLSGDDIDEVIFVYSHAHFDHIGGATGTYEYVLEAFSPSSIEIYAAGNVREEFEERIAMGMFSFRAPLPTVDVNDPTVVSAGKGLEFSLTPTKGHSSEFDLVIYIERSSEYPPILMFVVSINKVLGETIRA